MPALNLQGATVKGSLRLTGSRVQGSDEYAIMAGGVEIGAGAYFDDLVVRGEALSVLLNGAQIGLGLNFCDSELDGSMDVAGAHIRGPLFLLGLNVNGGEPALFADGLRVDGAVFMKKFIAHGGSQTNAAVHFTGATVGHLSISEARIVNPDGPALVAEHLEVQSGTYIHSNVEFTGTPNPKGVVSLAFANLGALAIAREVLERASNDWLIDGISFSLYEPSDTGAWLSFFRNGTVRYAAQPYTQYAAIARGWGRDHDARSILIGQRWDSIRRGRMSRFELVGATLSGIALGFGYKSWRALIGLGATLIASLLLVLNYGDAGLVHTGRSLTPGSRCSTVEKVSYAVDIAVPLVDTGTGVCGPRSGRDGDSLRIGGGLLQVVSWGAATLFLAGFTDLIRKPH